MNQTPPGVAGIPHAPTAGRTVVVAPDSFKGSASARDIGKAIAEGWESARPGDHVTVMPMADGGEGSLEAIHASVAGSRLVPTVVTGPHGWPVHTEWLQLPDGDAVIELARCCGLTLLESPRPLDASTRGLGEAMLDAIEKGATRLIIALGGSASTDGGSGALSALGAQFLGADGTPVADAGRGLIDLTYADLTTAVRPPSGGVTALTDVRVGLLGKQGAAQLFGPQKGASEQDIATLEQGLTQLARVLGVDPSLPGSGAAGGTAAGLAAWGATIVPGAPAIAEFTGTAELVSRSSIVITGEGRYDNQSSMGKVATHVRELGSRAGAKVGLIAGEIAASHHGFAASVSLSELAGSTAAAVREATVWARLAGQLLAELL